MIKLFSNKIGRIQLLLIFLVWVLIFTIPLLFGEFSKGLNWNHLFKVWGEYSLVLVIFFLNRFFLVPKLLLPGKRLAYFVSVFFVIFSIIGVLYFNEKSRREPPLGMPGMHNERFEHMQRPNNPPPPQIALKQEFIPPFANLLILAILIIGFDTGLIISVEWFKSEQKRSQLEKENVKNLMAFLKNQVSPHFFMNTLNNIHALVDINVEQAKNAIIELSQLMGYMLYESQSDRVSLKKELEFVKSYVELMQLRFTDDVDIAIEIPADLPNVVVPPLLTVSFIENAFKFGVSYEHPSFVHIKYEFEDDKLVFVCQNSLHESKPKHANSGIGLENSRQRIELIYGDAHWLNIDEDTNNNIFTVSLKTPL